MKASAQVVVIGGGVIGASVLYHLAELGWTDVVLVERKELTAGSTWHAAGGMHTLNGDPNVAKLQQYTVELYRKIEERSGQNCSIHMPGGLMLAGDRERMDWLRMTQARGRYLGMDLEIISAAEAKRMFPLLEEKYFVGALFDPAEGHVDPTGVTRAYAACARQAGAEIYQHIWVSDLRQRPDGTWDVITDSGDIHAEHIVNAGGLWAREVGRMIGLELPVLAMEHMYLITEDMTEVAEYNAATGHELPMGLDFDGEIYIRQEGGAMLLGTYEQACVPWSPREAPWTFDKQLLTPDLDRIAPSLEIAFKHYPAMAEAGIKNVINGPFTFAPDGNPLVGPVPGVRNCWVACAVMAGFSQGGGVGLTLARWMVDGDPGEDIWAMDVARYGNWASLAYTNAKVRENYSRRFRITFPNEELPAGRPLHTTPVYDRLTAHNAVWGAGFGLEHPLWFQRPGEEPHEDVTFRRSNAFPVVAEECTTVRERVGLTECSNFAKYRVTGAGSADWLQGLFTNRLPRTGRINLTAALDPSGHIVGEFSVARVGTDDFFLFGSQIAEAHHSRWFTGHLADGVRFDVLGLSLVGLSLAGPHARDVLQSVTDVSLATEDYPFMTFRRIDVGMIPAYVGRMTYTGDLGYEIWVAPEYQRALFDLLWQAGQPHGIGLFGFRALMSLRMEKMFGTWFREYRPIYTPVEAQMHRSLKLDHDFIGRTAVEAELARGPARTLGYFDVTPDPAEPADVLGDEPIWHGGAVVGWVTSGAYAHYSRRSLAFGYVPSELAVPGAMFEVEIIGQRRPARLLPEPVLDPAGQRMRALWDDTDGTTLMGRRPAPERRAELLDEVVRYLGRHGVAGVSLRPVARALGVSVNALVHHFGSKDELVVAALRRAAEIQRGVEGRWRRQVPHLSTADLQRRWWRWINRSPEHLALVQLGLEAATLDATVSGLPGDVRAEQISFWREGIADGLIADGIKPEDAEREASLVKATFTGLVLDLLATGQRKRLTEALECALSRLDDLRQTAP